MAGLLALALYAPAFGADAPDAWLHKNSESNLLLLEVQLGQDMLSDGISAYQYGNDVFLPLGALCKLLTIAIRVQPGEGQASGYVLNEERTFRLDVAGLSVKIGEYGETLDRSLLRLQADDIYVASRALARWLPLGLEIDMSSLTLRVQAREKLPLQARLERGNRAFPNGAHGGGYVDPGYPRHPIPYRMLETPVVDQTFGVDLRHRDGANRTDAAYTAYSTGDLLGMESALYLNSSKSKPAPEVRLTLGRNDPDAGLAGPLRARRFALGGMTTPGVANIAPSGPAGNGVALSNRPLSQPSSFDRHSLQGDLPSGWDVELYFNEALVATQQSRADGRYAFDDQPLLYGPNEFRLVFHGPLGQLRVERQSFLLDQASIAPGQLYYSLTEQRDHQGQRRSVAQFDWGLERHLTANGGLVTLPLDGARRRYANLGLRAFWQSLIVSADLAKAERSGTLAELGVKTRLGQFAVSASHARARDFSSGLYLPGGDPVRARDSIRVDGVVPLSPAVRIPLALEVKRDKLESGSGNIELSGRVSAYQRGTSLSNTLRWQSLGGAKAASGMLQASRRVAGFGVNGQFEYHLTPRAEIVSAALALNKNLADGYLLNLDAGRSFLDRQTWYSAGFNKSLGSYGLGIGASYSSRGDVALRVQLFVAIGKEPRLSQWHSDAQAMASSGAASIRVFLDTNRNGVLDEGEQAIQGAGFTINGGMHMARTDANGIAYLKRLPVNQHVDVGFDNATLEDPQWTPQRQGMRLVPRPGKVSELEFPVSLSGEIDGTAYLLDKGGKRGMGELQLELVDDRGAVVGRGRSSSDGYYIIAAVTPGTYLLRVAPDQLKRLKLSDTGMRIVTMAADGAFLNGVDFVVIPEWEAAR